MPIIVNAAYKVQGFAADGAAASGNPVQIAGKDGSGNIQALLVETDGTINVKTTSSTLPSGAATAANQSTQITAEQAIQTSVQIIDDWDESDRAKVNPIVGQAGIAAGAGAVGATVPRTTLASDDPAVVALQIMDDWDATHDSAVSSDGPQVLVEAKDQDGSAFASPVAEGDAVRPAASLYGVQYIMPVSEDGAQSPYDSVNNAFSMSEISPAELIQSKNTGITQLTAPGDTAEELVNSYSIYGYTFTVASIDTNVIVNLEGSIDQSNYAELPLSNTAVTGASITSNRMTVTANGTYTIYSTAPMVDVRFNWVSETGGTAATIDCDFFARR